MGEVLSLRVSPGRCTLASSTEAGPACGNTRPLATGQANPVPPQGEGYPPLGPPTEEASDG